MYIVTSKTISAEYIILFLCDNNSAWTQTDRQTNR